MAVATSTENGTAGVDGLTDDQKAIVEMVRQFVDEQIIANAEECGREANVPDAIASEATSLSGLPEHIAARFRGTKTPRTVHVPKGSPLVELPWREAGLSLSHDGPPGDAVSVSMADFAIAETGTIVFRSGPTHPSAWHFLSGTECVLVPQDRIVPTLEDVFARLGADGMPATLNLITGPSRTADIEQTIERGAHGPRALHVFVLGA